MPDGYGNNVIYDDRGRSAVRLREIEEYLLAAVLSSLASHLEVDHGMKRRKIAKRLGVKLTQVTEWLDKVEE